MPTTSPYQNFVKLASYPTNLLAETHAIYLRNNDINVSVQIVDLMGLNTGGVLWVHSDDLAQAQRLLDNIDENADLDAAFDESEDKQ